MVNQLMQALQSHASERRMDIGLQGIDCMLDYTQLLFEIEKCQQIFANFSANAVLAISLENHPAWLVLDMAAMQETMPQKIIPIVPLPPFFTDAQGLHAVNDAGANWLITDKPAHFATVFKTQIISSENIEIAGLKLSLLQLSTPPKTLPKNTAKITYTSGSTGNPKGVCLSIDAQMQVANAIQFATNLSAKDVHLCVLPLATLLENVAGVYAILLAGGTVHILPSAHIGLNGNSLNVSALLDALNRSQVSTAILTPGLLSALVLACEAGAKLPYLRFLAVGGAHVSAQLLQRAKLQNMSVYEGYGLSECASVVALNTEKFNKIGSVGKPLPHTQIQFSPDQEILVKGVQFLGYSNTAKPENPDEWLATGDIGYLDDDGFLHINGRKKNMFITSFGRNVSPEWLETALTSAPEILQACVFGEAKPANVAVITSNADVIKISAAIHAVNQQLPDYAQIKYWLQTDAPFSAQNQQLTANGRLKRDNIWQMYQHKINLLYKD
jgi:long-chain acyl-CoA synthetase